METMMYKLRFTPNAGTQLCDFDSASERQIAEDIAAHLHTFDFDCDELQIDVDKSARQVSLRGSVPDNETREKLMLCAGNIAGIGCVAEQLSVLDDTPTRIDWYTVKPGDTIQNLSRHFLRDYQKYMEIVEANAPMLAGPHRIYAGQMLRIPPEGRRCCETTIIRRKSVLPPNYKDMP